MNSLIEIGKKLKTSKVTSMVMAFFLVVLLLLYNHIFNTWGFLTNDDFGIQATLSGLFLGRPFPVHQFIHFCLGYSISFLYRVIPFVQWWFVYSVTVQSIGIFLATYSIFELSRRKNVSLFIALFALGILYSSLFVYTTANIAFTTVPAILGGGTASYVLMKILTDDEGTLANSMVKYYAISLVGIFISVIHRRETGMVVSLFFILTLVYMHTKIANPFKKKSLYRLFAQISVILMLLMVLSMSNELFTKAFNGNEFMDFNAERSKYTDYPVDSFEDNPEIYSSLGWNRELAYLKWYFADDCITPDSLRAIVTSSKIQRVDYIERLRGIKDFFRKSIPDKYIFLIHVICLAFLITYFVKKQHGIYDYGYVLMLNLLSVMLIVYFALKGRLISRAAYTIEAPLLMVEITILISMLENIKIRSEVILVMFLVFLSSFSACLETIKIDDRNKEKSHEIFEQTRKYVAKNKDKIFSFYPGRGVMEDLTVGCLYYADKPTNVVLCGGSEFHSKYSKELAMNNGMQTELKTEMFCDNKKYHMIFGDIYSKDRKRFLNFYKYLENKYHADGFTAEEYANGLYDISFVFEDDMPKGDYFTINNGKIVRRNNL